MGISLNARILHELTCRTLSTAKTKWTSKLRKPYLYIYLFIHSFIWNLFCFGYRISLYNSGLPGTQNPPALNYYVLEFQVFALMRLQENKNNIIKYQTYIWKICAGPVHWKVENMHKKAKHHINKGAGYRVHRSEDMTC